MKYKTGLVVGKFCPLHVGHEYVIKTALEQCEKVVVICYSNPALGYSAAIRKMWLQNLSQDLIVITPEMNVPTNDEAEVIHRNFCAHLCETRAFENPDVVFSSEAYGSPFAAHLSRRWYKQVDHVLVDLDRIKHPVSGTKVRGGGYENFLSPFVQATIPRRVLFIGGESSGKTTLCRALYKSTQHPWIPEYGRWYCESIGGVKNLKFNDMLHIGQRQIKDEEQILNSTTRPFIFCDTSPLVTQGYSQAIFNECDPELVRLGRRKYDKIFLCERSFGFVQDGDRRTAEFSKHQEDWYISKMLMYGMDFTKVTGSIDQRVNTVLEAL